MAEINPINPTDEKAYLMPTEKTTDDDLLLIAKSWWNNSSEFYGELEKIWKQNEDYYKGNQTEKDKIPSDMSNAVQNQIFMGVETLVPIMTSNPPQFVAEPPEETDTSVNYANTLQKVLSILYETLDVRTKGEALMRHMIIFRLGCWKVSWDVNTNNVALASVNPKKIRIPKNATELIHLIEEIDIPAQDFKDIFGEEQFKKFLNYKGKKYKEGKLDEVGGVFSILEFWSKDFVFWTDYNKGFLIKKQINPYYDFEDKEKNHFYVPQIPYILASAFRLNNKIIGETDLIQQAIPIQDVINVTERQIVNNANKTGNMQWRVDSSVMSEEEANTKLTNSPGLIIFGNGVANENLLRRDTPPAMPAYIDNLKIMAERAFDNIFGTHSTTRGERGQPETLGGRLLLKQADHGRIDLLVREYERCVSELGNWFTQLMKLFYQGKRTFRYYGETGLKFVNLMPEMIEKGVRVVVKSGTTLPTDELSRRREALELWSLGAIDPVTLFERLKFPNPEQAAQKLIAWKQGQIAQQAQLKQGAPESVKGRDVQPFPSPQEEIGRIEEEMVAGIEA